MFFLNVSLVFPDLSLMFLIYLLPIKITFVAFGVRLGKAYFLIFLLITRYFDFRLTKQTSQDLRMSSSKQQNCTISHLEVLFQFNVLSTINVTIRKLFITF